MFEPGDICHNSLGYWTNLLADIFTEMKIEAIRFRLTDDPDQMKRDMESILAGNQVKAALMFNASPGFVLFAELFREYKVSFYNYIVDHPLFHHRSLANAFEGYNVICMDADHQKFVENYYPGVNKVFFLPLAGMEGNSGKQDLTAFIKRPYDIIFTGNLNDTDHMINNLANYPQDHRDLYMKWIEYMLLNAHLSPEEALQKMIEDAGGAFSKEQFLGLALNLKEAVVFVRNYIREEVISSLLENDIPIHIFGSGWDKLKQKYPDKEALFHGDVSIDQTIRLNGESKMVLNILPWFRAGSHDRIITAQLNGAAVLTDANGYLETQYTDRESIYYFGNDSTKDLPQLVEGILSDPESIYQTSLGGMEIARRDMTWGALAERLAKNVFFAKE